MIHLLNETVMDVKDVAARFRVSQITVYRWFDRGLERVKLGGCVRTSLEAVQRFAGQGIKESKPASHQPLDAEQEAARKRLEARGVKVR